MAFDSPPPADEHCRHPFVIVDEHRRVLAVPVGRPVGDSTWDNTVDRVVAAFGVAGREFKFPKVGDRRGKYNTFAVGVSYGGGQKVCGAIPCVPDRL